MIKLQCYNNCDKFGPSLVYLEYKLFGKGRIYNTYIYIHQLRNVNKLQVERWMHNCYGSIVYTLYHNTACQGHMSRSHMHMSRSHEQYKYVVQGYTQNYYAVWLL